MPRIYILLMSVLISAFYACDHRGKPYPATLSRIESLADTNPEEARPLLDRLRDSLSSFDEEQRMYYDLLDLKVNDKMYVRHTSDSLIKRITAFYETYGDRDKLLESYYYMGRVYRDLNDAPEALKYFQKALDVAGDTRKYRLLSNVYSQMGMLYDYQNVYEEAIRMYEKAAEYKLLTVLVTQCLRIAQTFNRLDVQFHRHLRLKPFIQALVVGKHTIRYDIVVQSFSGPYVISARAFRVKWGTSRVIIQRLLEVCLLILIRSIGSTSSLTIIHDRTDL